MTHANARRIVLLLGVLLTTSYGYAQEPRSRAAGMEPTRETRKALAESIPRRELELALREREEVLVEVEKRIQEMGVNASADELTDLLEQKAPLGIALDKCRLENAGGCRAR